MEKILISWIGQTDLNASVSNDNEGPILSSLKAASYNKVYLLSNYPKNETKNYLNWIKFQGDFDIEQTDVDLESP
ncbi:AAA family ATPase, partial [bacterium]|nr:AAA family ATPase [bacterium]